jgi:RNA polymerase sigma-70 factor, ECF subfamily
MKILIWKKSGNEKHLNDLFQEIWEVYHPKLQVYISHFYNSGNASDLVSDILLHVFETIDRYKSDYSFSTWLYTVARNYSIDLLRKKSVQTENIDDHLLGNEETPESILIRNTEQEMVRQAVTCLSATDKELIYLYFYEELKYREISEITGIPEGTIKYRMSENKKILKKNLQRSLVL